MLNTQEKNIIFKMNKKFIFDKLTHLRNISYQKFLDKYGDNEMGPYIQEVECLSESNISICIGFHHCTDGIINFKMDDIELVIFSERSKDLNFHTSISNNKDETGDINFLKFLSANKNINFHIANDGSGDDLCLIKELNILNNFIDILLENINGEFRLIG